MPAKLIVVSKQEQFRREISFDKPRITIGRKPGNDLQFNRPEISGSHVAFLYENDEYFVHDLGSTNGTLLNGAKLVAGQNYALQHQDVITVAPYRITFVSEQDISDTMKEEAADQAPRGGSGTILDVSGIRTGTEEHKQQPTPSQLDKTATPEKETAKGQEAEPKPAPAAAPEPPSPEPPKPPEAAPVPPPEPDAAEKANESPSPQPIAAPGVRNLIEDYLWLGIGGLILLLAVGLILFLLFL